MTSPTFAGLDSAPSADMLAAIGEHLELVARAVKDHADVASNFQDKAQERSAGRLTNALARSAAMLKHEMYGAPFGDDVSPSRRTSAGSAMQSDAKNSICLRVPYKDGAYDETSDMAQTDDAENLDAFADDRAHTDATESEQGDADGKKVSIFAERKTTRSGASNAVIRSLEAIMEHPTTEYFFAGLITLNVLCMILEAQFGGASIGHEVGFYKYYGSHEFLSTTGAPQRKFFLYSECVFAFVFTVEIVLRVLTMRFDFLFDPWMWLDTSVVLVTDFSVISEVMGHNFLGGTAVIRAWRLVRLLRILRLARKIQTFDSLYLMTTALGGSMRMLFWVCLFLFVIQTLCALLITNIIQEFYLVGDFLTPEQKKEVFEFFGTYWRAMVSLLELMLANWPPICRLMMGTLHESWSVAVVLYKVTMGFGVVGVIMGVFTQETFKAAETDDQLMLTSKAKQIEVHTRKMRMLFSKMTEGKDSEIDVKTFKSFLRDDDVKMWLKAMDYDTSDASLLFYLIDKNGDGSLSVDELIEGMASLKGSARNIDIKVLLRQSVVGRLQAQAKAEAAELEEKGQDSRKVIRSTSQILRALDTGTLSVSGHDALSPRPLSPTRLEGGSSPAPRRSLTDMNLSQPRSPLAHSNTWCASNVNWSAPKYISEDSDDANPDVASPKRRSYRMQSFGHDEIDSPTNRRLSRTLSLPSRTSVVNHLKLIEDDETAGGLRVPGSR